MFSRTCKGLLSATLAFSAIAFSAPASADDAGTIGIFYHVPKIGIGLSYISMGYTNEEGNFVSLAGQQILSGRVVVDFTPEAGVDVGTLHMDMAVPVTNAQSQFFQVLGSDLIETTPGTFRYELTTNLYNGTIYEGRFGIESYGLTPEGLGVTLPGTVSADTGYYFTVSSPVPEPAAALLLLGGLAFVPIVVKRSRKA